MSDICRLEEMRMRLNAVLETEMNNTKKKKKKQRKKTCDKRT
jgi:hypothetical protein